MSENRKNMIELTWTKIIVLWTFVFIFVGSLLLNVHFLIKILNMENPKTIIPIIETAEIKVVEIDDDRFVVVAGDSYLVVSRGWELSLKLRNCEDENEK